MILRGVQDGGGEGGATIIAVSAFGQVYLRPVDCEAVLGDALSTAEMRLLLPDG